MDIKKVLVIDDEAGFCDMVGENLELRGTYRVFVATNGKAGYSLAAKLKPDIILLDIRMPDMDGFEVLKKLKADINTISIPVIVLSALDDNETKIKCAQLYNDLYLTKPIKIAELQAKIEEVLKRKSAA